MKTSRRIITMLLAAVLTASLAACGTTSQPQSTSESSESASESTAQTTPDSSEDGATPSVGYELPLTTEDVTLVIAGLENYGDRTYESGLAVFQEMEQKTGVKLKFETTIQADFDTVTQTRLAAGAGLADIISLPGPTVDPLRYANDGVIIEIGELIAQHAPNISAWFDKEPGYRKDMTTPDGKIYSLGFQMVENNGAANDSLMPPAHVIRGDWLEKLGLEMPTTIDELEKVFIAFRDEDPNGNGQKDEIPYSFPKGWNIIRMLGWSYDLHLSFNQGYYPDANGQIQYDIIRPEFKELLTLANRWYAEGLIDQGFTPENWDKWNSQIINSMVGCVPMSTIYPDAVWNGTIREMEGNDTAGFVPMYPIAGPSGASISEASFGASDIPRFSITRDCKDPELAIKFIDYTCYSEQGILWNEFGIEGQTYDMVDGKPIMRDSILHSPDGMTNEMWRIGGYHSILPQVLTAEGRRAAFIQYENVFDISSKIYNEVTVKTPLLRLGLPTAEEAREISTITVDLDTYVNEMIDKFILGDVPLSEFDNFVQTIKGMGIDRILEIKQLQYKRYNAN